MVPQHVVFLHVIVLGHAKGRAKGRTSIAFRDFSRASALSGCLCMRGCRGQQVRWLEGRSREACDSQTCVTQILATGLSRCMRDMAEMRHEPVLST
eukprot:scaffold9972_cov118-Isochrysis_galbana.AAC.18